MDEITPGRFFCPRCPQRFATLGDKKRHIRKEHTDEEEEN